MGEVAEEGDFTIEYESPRTEFESFCRIAPLVALRKVQEQHLPKMKKSYFEGFFTFDTTAQTKKGLFDEKEVVSENALLFPIMEMAVLEYLLTGSFAHIRDVVEGVVKNEQCLDRRNETIQVCYHITKPTVVGRNKLYRQLWEAVNT